MNYMPQLYDFLRRLSANNNRPWFKEHKDEYDMLREAFLTDVQRLISHLADTMPEMRGLQARDCVYRIYRDTRFSLDKTPYKTFFSASFSPYGRSTHRAAYYLQLGPGADSGLYIGCWMPDAAMLRKLRRAIADNHEELHDIINNPKFAALYPTWVGERLKTAPKGYDINHPAIDALRQKDLGRFHPCTEDFFADDDWPQRAAEIFDIARPLVDFLNYSLDEDVWS